jgi:hypothetical protein
LLQRQPPPLQPAPLAMAIPGLGPNPGPGPLPLQAAAPTQTLEASMAVLWRPAKPGSNSPNLFWAPQSRGP